MVKYSQFYSIGGGGSPATYKQLATGALVQGNNTISLGVTLSSFTCTLSNATNTVLVNAIYPDPANPTTKVIINVTKAIPAGLTLTIVGKT